MKISLPISFPAVLAGFIFIDSWHPEIAGKLPFQVYYCDSGDFLRHVITFFLKYMLSTAYIHSWIKMNFGSLQRILIFFFN